MEITINELRDIISTSLSVRAFHDINESIYRFVVATDNNFNDEYSISFVFEDCSSPQIEVLIAARNMVAADFLNVANYTFKDLYQLSSLLCQKTIETIYFEHNTERLKVVKKVTKAFINAQSKK